jgi:hypothetical protein
VAKGKGAVRFKTESLVLGQEFMVPAAMGVVWDLSAPYEPAW